MIPARAGHKSALLITGADGFIGRALVTQLQHSGTRLLLLDQSATPNTVPDETRRTVAYDISNPSQLRRVFESEQIGGIIHLAAVLPTAAGQNPARATQVNVVGSMHLLELACEFGVHRFVFGSSLSVYGTCPPDEIVDENFRAAPEDLYGAAKLYTEQLGNIYADGRGLEFVSLRIGRVIGSGARSTTSAWRSELFEFLRATHPVEITIPYVASERILVVHVDDVAKALLQLLQTPRLTQRVYNAPCESLIVADLKNYIESLNTNLTVRPGESSAMGNPRMITFDRFRKEFGFEAIPVFDRLRQAAAG
jgi:UDP-glucose 4-epimerase